MGLIIQEKDTDYSDMTKIGKVEIRVSDYGVVEIVVSGFKYADPPTCRMMAIRSMKWARDLLDAKIKLDYVANNVDVMIGD